MRGNSAATLGDQPGLSARVARGPEPAPKPKATHQDFPRYVPSVLVVPVVAGKAHVGDLASVAPRLPAGNELGVRPPVSGWI